MAYSTILFEVSDGVARLTLNRPEAVNAINREMAWEMMDAAQRCDDASVRAVLITGAGRMFCGGGDIKAFAAVGDELPVYIKELTTYLHQAVSRLARLDAPVVAAVQGSAAGAGLPFACSADITLAAESARFTMAYTRIGLAPDGGSTYFMPRFIGLKRAIELALTNRVLSAQEALDWGIVTRVVPDAELFEQAERLAVELAAGPTRAFGAAKRLMQSGLNETLETQLESESRAITAMARTADGGEGIAAFLAKRPATFTGK